MDLLGLPVSRSNNDLLEVVAPAAAFTAVLHSAARNTIHIFNLKVGPNRFHKETLGVRVVNATKAILTVWESSNGILSLLHLYMTSL